MAFKAVIFDLDGTLLDSLRDLADTLNTVLARHGYPTHELQQYRYLVGYGTRELVRRALPQDIPVADDKIETLLGEMEQQYAKTWKDHTKPYPGIPEMLDNLFRSGIKKGILSNKPHAFTCMCVETLLPSWKFDAVMGHLEGLGHKPDPQSALLMAAGFGVNPGEVLYIGDSSVDMQTANRAGMYPLGVLWGFREREELLENGAKTLVANPLEITEFLEQSNS